MIACHTLPNGLRVLTEPLPGFASAALGVWIEAGGRHETKAQNGLAHFLEHMAFKGTARRTALQIAEEIEDVGGYINAYTGREMTAYYTRVLSGDVALGLDIIGDILMNPAFEQSEIEVERGVILQEIGQTLDTPDDVIFDWLQEAAYPDQPMGRSILGPPETVRAFQAGDFRAFTGAHYSPDRIIVAAAGGIDPDAIVKQAEQIFGGLTRRGAPDRAPARFTGGEFRQVRPLEQAHFTLGLEAPRVRDADFHAAQIFATVLGGGMSSRLFQEAREKRGLCYSIFAQAASYDDTGMLTIYSGVGGAEIGALSTLVIDEIRRAADGVTEQEAARARAQMKAGMLMGLESAFGRCERMARSTAIWGRTPDLDEMIAKIDAVDAAAARAAGQRMIESPGLALALLGPVEGAPEATALAARLAA